jgi:hypothetical protein
MSDKTDVYVAGAGEPVARAAKVPQERNSQEIRRDIEAARVELGQTVDSLRGRVNELTDWRRQVREHRRRRRRLRDRRHHRPAPPGLGA